MFAATCRKLVFSRAALLLLLAVPLIELITHTLIVAHVPSPQDYRAAADFIRSRIGPRDLVTSAPVFIDPIVRMFIGDRIPLAMAGRSDDASYERMWVVSIRDALPPDAPRVAPSLTKQLGHVRVLRYELPKSPVLFDFVSAWRSASVTRSQAGSERPCSLRRGGVPRGGGLGRGVIWPLRERFDCDAARPQLFVGPVVMEDLGNAPHHCLWQFPQGDDPITVTFHDVPLGEELIFYAGIYYEHERMRRGGPVTATISVDGTALARFDHRDGDGWGKLRVLTAGLGKTRGEVSVAVRASDPTDRSFCWARSCDRAAVVHGVRAAAGAHGRQHRAVAR
jgi:hypothetical protein